MLLYFWLEKNLGIHLWLDFLSNILLLFIRFFSLITLLKSRLRTSLFIVYISL